jgi:hypothetical protein
MDFREAVLCCGLAGVVGEINIPLRIEADDFVQGVHAFVKRAEPRVTSFLLLLATGSFLVFAYVLLSNGFNGPMSILKAGLVALTSLGAFLSGLSASIMLYRLGPWHPLAEYPGPILAKVSKCWMSYYIAQGHRNVKLQEYVPSQIFLDSRPTTS